MKRHDVLRRALIAAFALFVAPMIAWGASSISVDGSDPYTEAASGTGSRGGTWDWGGPDGELTLSDFDGDSIDAAGDLVVNVEGSNTVSVGITTHNETPENGQLPGALTIQGTGDDASLTIGDGDPHWIDYGTPDLPDQGHYDPAVLNSQYDMTIDNVDITLDQARIITGGTLTIKDSTVKGEAPGAPIVVNSQWYSAWDRDNDENWEEITNRPILTIDNSTVHVINEAAQAEIDERYNGQPEYADSYQRYIYSAVRIYADPANSPEDSRGYWTELFALTADYVAENLEDYLSPELWEQAQQHYYPNYGWDIAGLFDDENLTVAMHNFYLTDGYQDTIKATGFFEFLNVDGDIKVVPTWAGKDFYMTLVGEDGDFTDTLIEPITEEEQEEVQEENAASAATAVAKAELPATGDLSLVVSPVISSLGIMCAGIAVVVRKKQDEA